MHRGMCSGAGNRVFRAAERLIRACNPFEASPSRLWSLLTLIPQRIRRAVTAAAAACYTYTLAQFLAMVCLLLASAFVQLTMKVRGCWQGGGGTPKRLCAHARNRGFGERIWSAYSPSEARAAAGAVTFVSSVHYLAVISDPAVVVPRQTGGRIACVSLFEFLGRGCVSSPPRPSLPVPPSFGMLVHGTVPSPAPSATSPSSPTVRVQ